MYKARQVQEQKTQESGKSPIVDWALKVSLHKKYCRRKTKICCKITGKDMVGHKSNSNAKRMSQSGPSVHQAKQLQRSMNIWKQDTAGPTKSHAIKTNHRKFSAKNGAKVRKMVYEENINILVQFLVFTNTIHNLIITHKLNSY